MSSIAVSDVAQPLVSGAVEPMEAPASLFQQAVDAINIGGPVVWILLGLSVIAVTLILVKIWQFGWLGVNREEPVAAVFRQWRQRQDRSHADPGDVAGADSRHPVAHTVQVAIALMEQHSLPPALLREELQRVGRRQLENLRSFLRPLDVIGQISPLLGLLGTVLGMIGAFQQLAGAGRQVDPALLSGGIWEALLTTAVGIAVAIPVVTAHNWLERRVERCALAMEDALTRVFTSAPALEQARAVPFERRSHAA